MSTNVLSIAKNQLVMSDLSISAGQWTDKGVKPVNEDSCAIQIPTGSLLNSKGISVVIADGVSGSDAGKEASDACVKGFISDYYSTPESWSVKNSVQKVLTALNRWLHGQGHYSYGSARGMVTTLSMLILKSTTAHLFHVGDTRIYRLQGREFECLTRDHRVLIAKDKNYLSRALGIELDVDIDYRALPLSQGDVFILTTDGVHETLETDELLEALSRHSADPEQACKDIVEAALKNGSQDNVSCQIVCVDRLPALDQNAAYQNLTELPFPPPLEPGMVLDGHQIIRELHASKRTELYLALDKDSGEQVILKAPSVNFEDDPTYIDLFLHEEWVGRRLDNAHILKVREPKPGRKFLYYTTEYIEGQTLRQWMHDHPRPSLIDVRNIVDQIVTGLRAFHRLEMIHQDLKPENIMIDKFGSVKIIDFGSTKIAGIEEIATPIERAELLGTKNYTAPEYLRGTGASNRSDIFSLGVIVYEMLTAKLPYGDEPSEQQLRRAHYTSARKYNLDVPAWVDGTLQKALHPDPQKRYSLLSEFTYDLSHPNPQFVEKKSQPVIERNPVGFWRGLAILLLVINLFLLIYLAV